MPPPPLSLLSQDKIVTSECPKTTKKKCPKTTKKKVKKEEFKSGGTIENGCEIIVKLSIDEHY